ncbi:MAG TPA: biotin/lipoyl-containing protein [Dehalococcoidia bacterium]|nr:biotin/lipoyl-containing protein [Dehalococcoidia bacterium]
MKLVIQGQEFEVQPSGDSVTVGDQQYAIRVVRQGDIATVYVNERPYNIQLAGPPAEEGAVKVLVDAKEYEVEVKGRAGAARPKAKAAGRRPAPAGGAGAITATMTGRIIRVDVHPGEQVKEGQVLLIIEAMKMENEIAAPVAGTVKEVAVAAGARVTEGDLLVVVEAAAE